MNNQIGGLILMVIVVWMVGLFIPSEILINRGRYNYANIYLFLYIFLTGLIIFLI
jgi:hypothetical protein